MFTIRQGQRNKGIDPRSYNDATSEVYHSEKALRSLSLSREGTRRGKSGAFASIFELLCLCRAIREEHDDCSSTTNKFRSSAKPPTLRATSIISKHAPEQKPPSEVMQLRKP